MFYITYFLYFFEETLVIEYSKFFSIGKDSKNLILNLLFLDFFDFLNQLFLAQNENRGLGQKQKQIGNINVKNREFFPIKNQIISPSFFFSSSKNNFHLK